MSWVDDRLVNDRFGVPHAGAGSGDGLVVAAGGLEVVCSSRSRGWGAAFYAGFELWMMHARTPEEFGVAARWAHVPVWVLVVSLVGFARLHLRAGRSWLGWTICGLRTLALLLDFVFHPSLNYREITALRQVPFLGESVSVPVALPNPWMLVGQLSLLLLVIFFADAIPSGEVAWRRGDRRLAVIGGSIVFFTLAGMGQAVLFLWGIVHAPLAISPFYLAIVLAMAFETSLDLLRAAELSEALRESEGRFRTMANAAPVMIWMSGTDKLCTFFNKGWLDFTGRTVEQELGNGWAEGVHRHDFDRCLEVYQSSFDARERFEMEYRLRRRDGEYHWILDIGAPRFSTDGSFLGYIGSCIDITARKLAEEAAHDSSGRLIQCLEEEARERFARELHDDLSQNLALLSVELEMFGQKPSVESAAIAARMQEFSAQVKGLSADVHQLSHELHPAKLEQLGLSAALRGFSKEFARTHEMALEFAERDVSRTMPDDTALCLYRIAQEALHNVVKHSGGSAAQVELTRDDAELRLVVADDGAGFDPQAVSANGSLGLVSMRERVRFVGGRLAVDSHPGGGTRIEVRVAVAGANGHSSEKVQPEASSRQ